MLPKGTLFINTNSPNSSELYICIADGKGTWLANSIALNQDGAGVFDLIPSDIIATKEEIARIMGGRAWPTWVLPLLGLPATKKTMPHESVTVRPGAKLYNPPPPAPEPKGPEILTLQTFQNQCNHKWMPYVGFSKVYMYCSHCDKKKEVEK